MRFLLFGGPYHGEWLEYDGNLRPVYEFLKRDNHPPIYSVESLQAGYQPRFSREIKLPNNSGNLIIWFFFNHKVVRDVKLQKELGSVFS